MLDAGIIITTCRWRRWRLQSAITGATYVVAGISLPGKWRALEVPAVWRLKAGAHVLADMRAAIDHALQR